MNLKNTFWIQGLIAFVITAFLVGCEANPTQPGEELVVAAGKPEKPPKPSKGGELEFVGYSVRPATELPLGLTNDPAVNAAVYAYFDSQGEYPGEEEEGSWQDPLGTPRAGLRPA